MSPLCQPWAGAADADTSAAACLTHPSGSRHRVLHGPPGPSLARGRLSSVTPGQDAAAGEEQAQEWAKRGLPLLCCCARRPRELPAEGLGLAAGPAACRVLGRHHWSYCRDLTIALRAWGVSGTEGVEL